MNLDSGIHPGAPSPGQPRRRRMLGWPSTRPGVWSALLMAGFFLFFGLFQLLVFSGQRGGETFFSNPWLALTILTAATLAVAGGITSAVAIFRRGERSLLAFLALLLGFLVTVFVLGEIVSPH